MFPCALPDFRERLLYHSPCEPTQLLWYGSMPINVRIPGIHDAPPKSKDLLSSGNQQHTTENKKSIEQYEKSL